MVLGGNNKIIVYASTRNLYKAMLPSIRSLFAHNHPEKVYLMIEDDEFPYKLPEECECINVSSQEYFLPNGGNADSVFTYMAMMRVTYAYLFPQHDKVLQLDVDTIICDDLTPLWETDIEGKWFAACPEYKGYYNPWRNDKYYNIGVCLYNLKQMREDNPMPKMIKLLHCVKLCCVEQDTLNFFGVPEKCVDIPVRYNESFCCGQTDNPAIVHYAGYPDWYTNEDMPRREYLLKWM